MGSCSAAVAAVIFTSLRPQCGQQAKPFLFGNILADFGAFCNSQHLFVPILFNVSSQKEKYKRKLTVCAFGLWPWAGSSARAAGT